MAENLVNAALDLLRPDAMKAVKLSNLVATLEKIVSIESYLAEMNAALSKAQADLPALQATCETVKQDAVERDARSRAECARMLSDATDGAKNILQDAQIKAAKIVTDADAALAEKQLAFATLAENTKVVQAEYDRLVAVRDATAGIIQELHTKVAALS